MESSWLMINWVTMWRVRGSDCTTPSTADSCSATVLVCDADSTRGPWFCCRWLLTPGQNTSTTNRTLHAASDPAKTHLQQTERYMRPQTAISTFSTVDLPAKLRQQDVCVGEFRWLLKMFLECCDSAHCDFLLRRAVYKHTYLLQWSALQQKRH